MVDTCICLSVVSLLAFTSWSHAQEIQQAPQHLIEKLDDVGQKLSEAVKSVQRYRKSLDDEVSCRFHAGTSGCLTQNIDIIKHLMETLRNRHNPGKRSIRSVINHVNPNSSQNRLAEDVMRKREVMDRLSTTLADFVNTIHNERKRSCQLNLGFHCQTEEYSNIADMYNFLQSAMSPGKRK